MSNEELLALSSVEMRRRIGTKEISPVELLEACLQRIEEINPAVNAVTAMCVPRARKEAQGRRAGGAPRRGSAAAARPADRHQGPRRDQGPAHHLRLAALSRLRAGLRQRHGGPRARRRRGRRRQDQRAGIRRRLEQPQPGVGRHRQSVQSDAQSRRLVGRLGGGARDRHAAGLHRLRHRRLAAQSRRRSAASWASAPRPAWSRSSAAPWAGRRSRCWARWAAASPTSACSTPRRSASTTPIRSASRSRPKRFAEPWPVDLGSLGSPTPRISAARRSRRASAPTFREKIKAMKPLFRRLDKVEVDYGGADRCFDVIRAVSLPVALPGRSTPTTARCSAPTSSPTTSSAPSSRSPTSPGRMPSRPGSSARFQELYKDYDLVIGPTVGFTPFPWKQLYIDEMDGKKLQQLLPLDGDEVLRHADQQSRRLAALRPRPQEDAVRPAGDRPLPRRRRGAGRRARHGAGIQGHPRPRPAAAQSRQARASPRRR